MHVPQDAVRGTAPRVTEMRVIPVAGRDGMLLNLSGAHGPFFTRNVVILEDNAGNTGVGEVPGGERIGAGFLRMPHTGSSSRAGMVLALRSRTTV